MVAFVNSYSSLGKPNKSFLLGFSFLFFFKALHSYLSS